MKKKILQNTLSHHALSRLRLVTASMLVIASVAAFTAAVSFANSTTPDTDAVSGNFLRNMHSQTLMRFPRGHSNGMKGAGVNGTTMNLNVAPFLGTTVDSVRTFDGQYFAPGYEGGFFNNHWYLNTLGNAPQFGGTTTFNAPIIPVSVDMRNSDGSPRYVRVVNQMVFTCDNANLTPDCHRLYYDATTFTENGTSLLNLVLNSPVFANASYSSSVTPTQITDAIDRAEFFHMAKSDWHTVLSPAPKTPAQPYVMTFIQGTYFFSLNDDNTCCRFVLVDTAAFANQLFPQTIDLSDTSTILGRAEHGDITQHDIATFLFPNTFLYSGPLAEFCCVLGFHSFDAEIVNNVTRFYVFNYSSWISPGFLPDAFKDVTALSHEMAETFNDPFVAAFDNHNLTQIWLAPNGNCQANRETGDVIEGLANATFPMMLNGFLYHPQNEALLQWFSGGSDSIDGALSYPDESVLAGTSGVPNPPLLTCP